MTKLCFQLFFFLNKDLQILLGGILLRTEPKIGCSMIEFLGANQVGLNLGFFYRFWLFQVNRIKTLFLLSRLNRVKKVPFQPPRDRVVKVIQRQPTVEPEHVVCCEGEIES